MDGAHTHGGNGGGVPPEAFMIIAVIAGVVIVGPIILAILQAIITILLICIGTVVAGLIGYLSFQVRRSYVRGTLPLQQRGNGRTIGARTPRPEITASTPHLKGHIILTPEEYEEIRQNRYGK